MSQDKIKEVLEKLHSDVAQELLDRITTGEATAAEISIAVKFLKDNSITVEIEESEPVLNLAKSLPFTEAKEA
tara:strand:+ start:1630 stop:1848 length:219 start_codon:yes stop_codon:yes gene_type:complete